MAEMGTIGQTLREAREKRGLTPDQAAYQSKVPLRLLLALEEDDYRLLPDPAYLIRLLHDYACVLGLDPVALEEDFRQAIRRPPATSLAVGPPPAQPISIPWRQVLWTMGAILVVIPLVFIALSLASKRSAERVVQTKPTEQAVQVVTSASQPAPVAADDQPPPAASQQGIPGAPAPPPSVLQQVEPAVSPVQPAKPSPSPVERSPRRYLLTARATEPTWIVVRADGGEQREVLLQTGQSARFGADKGFVITVGNAGGVLLSLNGEPMAVLGASGQVIRDLAVPGAPLTSSPVTIPSRASDR